MELLKNLEGLSADEQMSAVVELQKAAMKTLEDQKQASIGKSAELVIQGLKKIKSDFEAKFDSLNYDIQTKVANLKDGEQGLQGPKGEQGDRGLDGYQGKDGRDGKDGKDGTDGVDGVGVTDAKIDFDGSLVITLSDGREINVGEVVPVDVAEKIRTVHNIQSGSGGDSQTVLDAIAALQATIATYGTMATQNANNVAITGGTINNTTVGATTPSTGVFTTLTATGQTSLGGAAGAEGLRVNNLASSVNYWLAQGSTTNSGVQFRPSGSDTNVAALFSSKGTSPIVLYTNTFAQPQLQVSHTASAVNYVQVTGAPTSNSPQIQFTGSDAGVGGALIAKGNGAISFFNNGATTSRQFRVGAGVVTTAVNYINADGSATGNATQFQTLGTDTNIAMALRSTGTGAIDLAAGSSGVNISNGGTVTAITRTGNGTGYTSFPSVAISAPTTAGGVQATASVANMQALSATVSSGGTGYTLNDVVTLVGGTPVSVAATYTVTGVSGGVVTAVAILNFAAYTVLPTAPVSTTGGTGTGLTLTGITWAIGASFTITNAGSGYVEQPTVTFSGGGGSGAAAYATVGSGSIIRSLGLTGTASLDFHTPASATNTVPALRLRDVSIGTSNTGFVQIQNNNGYSSIIAQGPTNAAINLASNGTGSILFNTNSTNETNQMRVSHTASAVNYVQVTGSATSAGAGALSGVYFNGSDSNINGAIVSKGTGYIAFAGGFSSSAQAFRVLTNNAVNTGNLIAVQGAASGSSPSIQAISGSSGTDANIDLTLTPKGTGNVRFGTYTGTILTPTGYVEIKDSGGTVRRLLVG